MPTDNDRRKDRDPATVMRAFESSVDRQIREATERGEFDDLPGTGQPLDSVAGGYDPDWWARSFVGRERLRDEANDLRQLIRAELPRLRAAGDDAAKGRVEEINALVERVNERLPESDRIEPVSL